MQVLQKISSQYDHILKKEIEAERLQLERYRDQLAALVVQYPQAKSGPELPLTIPEIFKRSHNENFISYYLAYILHPQRNGIGVAPLAQFLQLLNIEIDDLPLEDVTIDREYQLGNRYIDLMLIWKDSLVLGIENKIISDEHNNQTTYYARVIEEEFSGIPSHMVYLSRSGKKLPSSMNFQPISYKQLLEAFRRISVEDFSNYRKRALWEDFLEHLEVYIVMSDPDEIKFSDKANMYIEHHVMFKDLKKSFSDEWGKAIELLERRLYSHLSGGPWETKFNPTLFRNYHQVYKPSWNFNGHYVHYEYHFSLNHFIQKKVIFTVDIEGKHRDDLLDQFDKQYLSIEADYQNLGISYRPPQRRFAIAWKEYPIEQDMEQISNVFISAFEEFQFLEFEIDKILNEYKIYRDQTNLPNN